MQKIIINICGHKYIKRLMASKKINLDRTSTNFSLQLFEHLKTLKLETGSPYAFLKYHQNIVREFINDVDTQSRGLLIYHSMGTGKSIVGVSVAMDQMTKRQPIVLLTKSLQQNFRRSIIKYIRMRTKHDPNYKLGTMSDGDIEAYIDRNFSFVSMNASNMIKQVVNATEGALGKEYKKAMAKSKLDKKLENVVSMGSLDNKLLIVDEAHNLFRAVTNGSKNAKELYDMVMNAKNLKIIFLTGTPVTNDPFELVPCFNMLAGNQPIFPELWKDFYKYFVDLNANSIKNKDKFQNRIMGMVSHITHLSTPGAAISDSGVKQASEVEFPEEKPTKLEFVPMVIDQYVAYQLARDKEKEEGKGFRGNILAPSPMMQKPKNQSASSYRQKSRQLSNFCPPEKFREQKFSEIDVYKLPADAITSPKFEKILDNVDDSPGIGYVYSQFVGAGGLASFMRFLELNGWELFPGQKRAQIERALKEENEMRVTGEDAKLRCDSAPIKNKEARVPLPEAKYSHSSKDFALIREDTEQYADQESTEYNKYKPEEQISEATTAAARHDVIGGVKIDNETSTIISRDKTGRYLSEYGEQEDNIARVDEYPGDISEKDSGDYQGGIFLYVDAAKNIGQLGMLSKDVAGKIIGGQPRENPALQKKIFQDKFGRYVPEEIVGGVMAYAWSAAAAGRWAGLVNKIRKIGSKVKSGGAEHDFRPADSKDFPKISQMHKEIFGKEINESILENAANNDRLYLMESGDKLEAAVLFTVNAKKLAIQMLLDPSGKFTAELSQKIQEKCKEIGCDTITITIDGKANDKVRFYDRLFFKVKKRDGDSIFMTKELGKSVAPLEKIGGYEPTDADILAIFGENVTPKILAEYRQKNKQIYTEVKDGELIAAALASFGGDSSIDYIGVKPPHFDALGQILHRVQMNTDLPIHILLDKKSPQFSPIFTELVKECDIIQDTNDVTLLQCKGVPSPSIKFGGKAPDLKALKTEQLSRKYGEYRVELMTKKHAKNSHQLKDKYSSKGYIGYIVLRGKQQVGHIVLAAKSTYIYIKKFIVDDEYMSSKVPAILIDIAHLYAVKHSVKLVAKIKKEKKCTREILLCNGFVHTETKKGRYILEYKPRKFRGGAQYWGPSYNRADYKIEILHEITKDNPVIEIDVEDYKHLIDQNAWGKSNDPKDSDFLSPRKVLDNMNKYPDHRDRILEADFSFPILLTPDENYIIDGMHRLSRAILENRKTIEAIIVAEEQLERARKKKGGGKPKKRRYFAFITGAVDPEQRQKIQDMFNSDDNKNGGIIDLLLLSRTGAEGLDLKNVRHAHIMEPYWNDSLIEQIKARGIRNDAHKALPKDQRNVQPFIYLATMPKQETKGEVKYGELVENALKTNNTSLISQYYTTDIELYVEAVRGRILINSFLEAIKEVSIECMLNAESNCRSCHPNNARLFYHNIEQDMRMTDPCLPVEEQKIKAKEIKVGDETYYYVKDDANPFGYKVYSFDEGLQSYVKMGEDTPLFEELIDAIEEAERKKNK